MKKKICCLYLSILALVGITTVVPKGATSNPSMPSVSYKVHGQTYGWQNTVSNGLLAGSTGKSKRLEAINLNVAGDGGIRYQVHGQSYGWQEWVSDGEQGGSIGIRKQMEAIKIELTGNLAKEYDVEYRVHGQTYGWQEWKKNGDLAGSTGSKKRLEAIEVKLVKKQSAVLPTPDPNVGDYNIAYQSFGAFYANWQKNVGDGATSGSVAQGKQLEAINIKVKGDGGVQYQVHGQTYGWQSWKTNGAIAGGYDGKRLEAIKIELTGNLAKEYDVEYRVHGQNYGWQEWKKNGELAGTVGSRKRLEAIEIKLVKKTSEPEPSEVDVTDVGLIIEKEALIVSETTSATSSVTPSNATNKSITYSSSNTDVATIDATGKIIAVAPGTTIITATASNDVKKAVEVTVTEKAQTPVVNVKEIFVLLGSDWDNSMLKQGFVNGTDEKGQPLTFERLTVSERKPIDTSVSGNYLYDVSYGDVSTVLRVNVQPPV